AAIQPPLGRACRIKARWESLKRPHSVSHTYVATAPSGDSGSSHLYRCAATGREIPSFFILEIKVVRFNPSRAAAPLGPPTIQSAARNACSIQARWESLNVPSRTEVSATRVEFVGFALAGFASSVGKGFGSTPFSERITALSTKF